MEAPQRRAYRAVKRKLIAAGMDAELERSRQLVIFHRKANNRDVLAKFLFELRDVPGVVHPFVEAPSEFRSYGLNGNPFVSDRGQNYEQFRRSLRLIRLINGNFGDETSTIFFIGDVAVNPGRLLNGEQIFTGDFLDLRRRRLEWQLDPRNFNPAN